MISIAREFSPRYERHGDHVVTLDVSGLGRLFGAPRAIGEAIAGDAARRGARVRVALAGTWTAARILAMARPGVTVVERGAEAAALAPLALGVLASGVGAELARPSPAAGPSKLGPYTCAAGPSKLGPYACADTIQIFKSWGLKTLGELAALPASDLAARLGRQGPVWQALARGEDPRPLTPDLTEERFDGSIDLEWPIDGLEPLSFVLTRLLEPLSTRLERRDRGAAVLHVQLGLVTDAMHASRLELPAPIRDVRTLRTLALLDLESHPPDAAIDRVTVVIEPTPGRVLQHTLFTRATPTPEQISTLLARLGALMGQDRIGAPAVVDSHRPGAFAMRAFAADHTAQRSIHDDQRRARGVRRENVSEDSVSENSAISAVSALNVVGVASALRRCRQPVPARVAVDRDRPVRVTTDRRGFAGGMVVQCAGPWRTSGEWWAGPPVPPAWHRDEWDVALADGAVYRIFQDRETHAWFIDAVVD